MSKSLTRIIGEGTALFSANNVILKFIGLGSTFVILTAFNVHEYGVLVLILSVIPLFGFITLPGIDSVVIADMGIEKSKGQLGKVKSIFKNYFFLQLALSILTWLVLFLGAEIIDNYYSYNAHLLRIVSFFFLLAPFRTAYIIGMRYELKYFQQSLVSFFEELFKLIFVLISIFIIDAGIEGILFAMLFSQALTILILTPSFLPTIRLIKGYKNSENFSIWDFIIKHGKWSWLSTYTTNFNKSARLWIIKFLLGTEITGLFALALGLYGHTTSLVPISSVIAPVIPQFVNQKDKFSRIVNKGVKYQTIGYVALGTIAFLVFPPIVAFIVPKYIASLPLYKVMLIGLIPGSFLTVLNPTFHALREQKDTFFSTIFRLAITLVLMPIFIILFGIMGVAYEFVVNMILYAAQRYSRIKKFVPSLEISYRHILSVDEYDKMMIKTIKNRVNKILKRA